MRNHPFHTGLEAPGSVSPKAEGLLLYVEEMLLRKEVLLLEEQKHLTEIRLVDVGGANILECSQFSGWKSKPLNHKKQK